MEPSGRAKGAPDDKLPRNPEAVVSTASLRDTNGRLRAIGVISWTTGPAETEGCGGMTGVTPLALYHPWIVEQAAKWGAKVW